MKKELVAEKLKRIAQIEKKLDGNKNLYSELDQLTFDLKDENLAEHGFQCVDNFSEKNVQFKVAAVRRFEIVPVKPAKK